MNLAAILLVIFSAVIHAFWNYTSKKRGATAAYFFLAVLASGMLLSPILYFYRDVIGQLPVYFWILVVLTGFFEALYYISLTSAYQTGDLSVAYPLLRAVPVVLVALISLMIQDGREPQGLGWIGILLVALGCLMLPLVSFRKIRLSSYLTISCLFALLAGFGTTGYSMVDDRALRLLMDYPAAGLGRIGTALFYLEIQVFSTLAFMGLYLLLNRKERSRLTEVFPGQFGLAAQTGFLVSATYGLVLVAMSLANSVSYVVAFRQMSIPIGAVLGMAFQAEPRHPPRLVGIGLVFAGLVLVTLA
jgi:drug/metabolite transporter (DMT)-like permease